MKLDISKIEFSKCDLEREVNLPHYLTKELAEFIGIMIGDGHLALYVGKIRGGKKRYDSTIKISGGKNEEPYLRLITDVFYKLFNLRMIWEPDKRSNAVMLVANSKSILQFLNKCCGVPTGRKSGIVCIPELIKTAGVDIKRAFLRGLADTDFSLSFQNKNKTGHKYPVLRASFKSKKLVQDLEPMFHELGFKHSTYYDELRHDKRFADYFMHNIYLYGCNNLIKWRAEIGFSNAKYARKLNKWDKDGVCPPRY